ncbi:permease [Anoxybacillus ayderensis]|uniref:permease n=1 Tax=Anoxybacillus ayderensis TaxID=265546 RepID=UPI000A26FBCC|nr:permease [Anoxybacillus ayderensis]MED0656852.1 permease [Anoxybacillus ayderensis]OSX53312.1 permease [Anoxybacillus ayderensis]
MFKLPESRSKQWYVVSIFLFFLFLCMLVVSRLLLNMDMDFKQLVGFAIISLILSCIIGIGGFFGKTTFVIISFAFFIIGMIYMLFISITDLHDGWSDITSIISFLTISLFGVVIGVIAEIIRTFLKKKST